MPIHVILGKPGSGKSLYATSRLILELFEGRRNVVTNLPLRPDRLNEFLQRRYPSHDCRMIQRLKVLSDDEMKEFWKHRGPDGDPGADGVAYFLDEAHIAFNAREWATLGKGALHYLSQHRKLGDIVWPITQAPGNLDKQFRSVAEDFTVLRNEYTAKFGPFRGRGRFVRRTYLSEPSGNAEPFETATFTLDKEGIASCYDTAKGIGVHGNKADIGRRAKGISIWWAVPGALALASLAGLIPWFMGKGAGSFIDGDSQKAVDAASVALRGGQSAEVAREEKPAELTATGVFVFRGQATVWLSDGSTLRGGDGKLESIEREFVWVSGKRLPIARGKVVPAPVPAGDNSAWRNALSLVNDQNGRSQ